MKQLRLKIQDEAVKIENVINFKRTQRNELIDAKKKAKKEKDTEAVEEYSRQIEMTNDDIIDLEAKYKECERDFDRLSHKLGKIRLDCYIFADIIYNTLLEYEEFLRNYVVNKQGDSDTTNALTTAIDNIKLLPFEMANGGYTNELYCQVTEKFMELWKTIRDGVIQEVLREVDDEYIEEQKTKKRK
jgi:hypothetical protein